MRRTVAALCAATLIALAAAAAVPAAAAKHRRTPPAGPFVTAAMRAFLASRAGVVTAGVYNVKTKRLFLYRPAVHGDDASIAKVDILATALYEAQQQGTTLTATQQQLATAAIEESDNDAAQDLWEDDGGNPGNRRIQREGWDDADDPRPAGRVGSLREHGTRPDPIAPARGAAQSRALDRAALV